MTGFQHLLYAVDAGVARVTLNRPHKRNAMTARMVLELERALDLADGDDNVRAVVITGAGQSFCSGADLSGGGDTFDPASRPDGEEAIPADRMRAARRIIRSFYSTKPVIGAINGAAIGVGATVTLPFDIRLAATDTRFGFVFTSRGIVPEAGSTWFLPRLVGISTAVEWCATARIIEADEALSRGLVRSVHAPEELLPAAMALAGEIASRTAPVSVAYARQMLWRGLSFNDPLDCIDMERRAMRERGAAADVREGISALIEKRSANFPDTVTKNYPGLG